ncbi:MAG: SMI1/KNR4 family protein [Planctomycetota bacterium]|nr:SMI1/KNR4 family protein [Planctomycetota bacterium]
MWSKRRPDNVDSGRGRQHHFPLSLGHHPQLGKPLPESYKEFVKKVGNTSYANLDDIEGFDAEIVGPDEIGFTSYRKGTLDVGDEESVQVDGVMFATTGHGDVFCFDIAAPGPDYPVYLFDHEQSGFSVFAPNFVACLKRFVERD